MEKMSPGVEGVLQGGTRLELVNKIVQNYRTRAYSQVLQEYPEVRKAVQTGRVTKAW